MNDNDTNTHKKKLSTWTQRDHVIGLWLWIFFAETRLLLDFSLKSERCWSGFFLTKVFKDKSVWSWKLSWMSVLSCPLNFASSFVRNSHHQYVFFCFFFPFVYWLIDWLIDVFIWKPNRLGVPSYRESHVPYCYYYLRVLYFANFCDLEKIAKISTRKNFYRHIWHFGVCTITNCVMFATLEHT